MCVCFPQNCRVQTVLQTSYESWGFWLHRAVMVREKQRKTYQEKEESICFHPKLSRRPLRPATLGKTAAFVCTHTHTRPLKVRVCSVTTPKLKFQKFTLIQLLFQSNLIIFLVNSLQNVFPKWGKLIIIQNFEGNFLLVKRCKISTCFHFTCTSQF